MEAPQIPNVKHITLPSHPDHPIAYTLKCLKGPSPIKDDDNTFSYNTAPNKKCIIWLLFVNGLGLPQAFWQPTIQHLESDLTTTPAIGTTPSTSPDSECTIEIYATTYDRYGQGLSRPQAEDETSPNSKSNTWTPTPHDCLDAATELAELIHHLRPIVLSSLHTTSSPSSLSSNSHEQSQGQNATTTPVRMILISHSLGVPITRLFVAAHHFTPTPTPHLNLNLEIAGLILIDSNIANINMADLLPDPDTANPESLPSDTTIEQLRQTRANYARLFAPSAPNSENLDRASLLHLLPRADGPVLSSRSPGSTGDFQDGRGRGRGNGTGTGKEEKRRLALTVIAHDPDAFAEEGLRIAARGLTMGFIEPAWRAYNCGLVRLDGSAEEDGQEKEDGEEHQEVVMRKNKIVVAKGAGHFVQRDNPRCVADEIWKIVERL